MKTSTTLFALSATFLVSASASAQQGQPSPAPDTLVMAESLNFEDGSSSNFQSMMIQLLDNYYEVGACVASDNWDKCDDLRFGFAINAGYDCDDTSDQGPLTWYYTPDEDRGVDVKARVQGIHGERNDPGRTYCNDDGFINHDTGLRRAWENTFPGTTSATFADLAGVASDPDDNGYWSRPHLNFFAVKNLPQNADGTPGDRVINSLKMACDMFYGLPVVDDNNTPVTTDDIVLGNLPSMPTWVLVERSANSDAHIFAGMLSAAGGTGECAIKQGNTWNALNMCEYVNSGVSEATLRDGIDDGTSANPPNGAYRCGGSSDPDKSSFSTGGLAASNLPGMRCHLSGDTQGQCNGGNESTDLFGLFKCVRQLPFGITAPPPGPDNDYVVRYCPNGLSDDIFDDTCVILRESQGDLQFIDENRTLFIITERSYCEGGNIDAFECPDEPCDTGGEGRCADGMVVCPDGLPVCKPAFEDYPEICNGLDDDCDGKVDNLSDSWESPLYSSYVLPEPEHSGKHCNKLDVCVCPDGATDLKNGSTFLEYLEGWGGSCMCGEGLEGGFSPAPTEEPAAPSSEPGAACTAVSAGSLPFSFVALAFLGLVGFMRRRK